MRLLSLGTEVSWLSKETFLGKERQPPVEDRGRSVEAHGGRRALAPPSRKNSYLPHKGLIGIYYILRFYYDFIRISF